MAVLKWSGIVVATLVLGLLAIRVLYGLSANPRVMEEITANPNGERAGIVMALTLPDGRTLPVNYRREGNHVYAGADGRWWRTLRDGNAPVTVLIRGETLAGWRAWCSTTRSSRLTSSVACDRPYQAGYRRGWMHTSS